MYRSAKLDELTLYDQTREELGRRLRHKFPSDFDLERTITAYAYWVCSLVLHQSKDWETTVKEYVSFAIRDAQLESHAEQIEFNLLRQELLRSTGPLLDVGAGWGRFGSIYADLGIQAVFVEPSSLGCQLLWRNNHPCSVRCQGQNLGLSTNIFNCAVIGWVLHHDATDVPSAAILNEIARVITPAGRLLSIEPLSDDFNSQKWRSLIETAGFDIEKLEIFFEVYSPRKKREQFACLAAIRRA